MSNHGEKDYDLAEDLCFICKDAGDLRICDEETCLKAYHSHCVDRGSDFLDVEDEWICGRHVCSCQKTSVFHCFCCTKSYCWSCIRTADFVQVKMITMGFCRTCLKLAKLIEEERDVDSDGGYIDFNDVETYEFLYKDYWEIVKVNAKLTLLDVLEADTLMKTGEKFQDRSNSDKLLKKSDEDGNVHVAVDHQDASSSKVGRVEEANGRINVATDSRDATTSKVSGRTEEGAKRNPVVEGAEEMEPLDIKIKMWYYTGLDEIEHGPWSLTDLNYWWGTFFNVIEPDIKVRKSGQRKEDAILLIEILALAFPNMF